MADADDRRAAAPFEQAALEELERLQRELEESRTRRRAAAQAFDALLKTFGRPATGPDALAPPTSQPAPPHAVSPLSQSGTHTGSLARANGETVTAGQKTTPSEVQAAGTRTSREASEGARAGRVPPAPLPAEPQQGDGRRPGLQAPGPRVPRSALFAGAAIILAAAVVFVPRARETASEDPAVTIPSPVEAHEADAPPSAVPPAARPAAELVARRQVWVRVTVDGERVLERELAADSRVPLNGGRTIVVRAGDAGAVRVWIAGEDQGALGGDGVVVTRTFTLPAHE